MRETRSRRGKEDKGWQASPAVVGTVNRIVWLTNLILITHFYTIRKYKTTQSPRKLSKKLRRVSQRENYVVAFFKFCLFSFGNDLSEYTSRT